MTSPAFSRRVPGQLTPNRIAAARRRCAGRFVDLTVSNPTECGFEYPPDLLLSLGEPAGLSYRPDPLGLASAREAVSSLSGELGVPVDPAHIVLTASTSEAYTFLFKLLCDPGDAVLVPTPSYPLFEHLAQLEGVRALPYSLREEGGWSLDLDELSTAPPDVRAVVIVHPNNPTGSLVRQEDAAALEHLCATRGWALIADEVFLAFPLEPTSMPRSFAGRERALTFTLGGLSKLTALPQLKLAWIITSGPSPAREAALQRLEFIADTFLSVATPVQLALPCLLRHGAWVRDQIRARCRHNLDELRRHLASLPAVTVPRVEGGWSVVVRVPSLGSEEDLVLSLLEQFGVAVHPGYFFEFPRDGYLVTSLLPTPEKFLLGAQRLAAGLGAWLDGA
ncbi:MAG: pyridoxal phosphate-dependent aminotransferase [Acidobacteriota bacterium]